MNFIVLLVEQEHAERLQTAIQDGFCVYNNPLAGAFCFKKEASKGYKYVFVPLITKPNRIIKKLIVKGFIAACDNPKSGEEPFKIVEIPLKKTGYDLETIRGAYDELAKKELS